MKFRITHTTEYQYTADVGRCYNHAHVIPRDVDRQRCLKSKVNITPRPAFSDKRQDYFGNWVYHFAIQDDHKALSITAESEVEMEEKPNVMSLDFGLTCRDVLEKLKSEKHSEILLAREFVLESPMIRAHDELRNYVTNIFADDRPFLSAVKGLTEKIYKEFSYDPGFTTIATPVMEVYEHKRGVCQDFAHFAIACLRSAGFAAKYVSGYLETLPPPGQEKLVGADATHAWFSVFSPGEGWYEFDPTNNQMASYQHIVTAEGRDFSDVTPLAGVIFGGGESHSLDVGVTVERIG